MCDRYRRRKHGQILQKVQACQLVPKILFRKKFNIIRRLTGSLGVVAYGGV